jgi:RNA polymerase sigma factor for flagellar operon FliA
MMNKKEFEQRILDHLYIVKIIASKLHARIPAGIELDDLVHSGVLGLIDAVKKYDPGKGARFTSYASLRIRGAILDELRSLDWASRSLRHKIKKVENAFKELEIKLGRPPREEEVAQSLGLSLPGFQELLNQSRGVSLGVFNISMEDEAQIPDEKMLIYSARQSASSPPLALEKKEMKELIASLISEIPQKEQLVLNLYYLEDLNLKEVGEILNLTESRISQIRTAAIIRLRGKLTEVARRNKVHAHEVL